MFAVIAFVSQLDLSNGIRPALARLMKSIMPDLAEGAITIKLVPAGMFRKPRINLALIGDNRVRPPTRKVSLEIHAATNPTGGGQSHASHRSRYSCSCVMSVRNLMSDSRQIEELRAEATYARERYHIYRAKMYGPRPTKMSRLRELERIHQGADARLRRAEEEHGRTP